jgi:hypothetical protein
MPGRAIKSQMFNLLVPSLPVLPIPHAPYSQFIKPFHIDKSVVEAIICLSLLKSESCLRRRRDCEGFSSMTCDSFRCRVCKVARYWETYKPCRNLQRIAAVSHLSGPRHIFSRHRGGGYRVILVEDRIMLASPYVWIMVV